MTDDRARHRSNLVCDSCRNTSLESIAQPLPNPINMCQIFEPDTLDNASVVGSPTVKIHQNEILGLNAHSLLYWSRLRRAPISDVIDPVCLYYLKGTKNYTPSLLTEKAAATLLLGFWRCSGTGSGRYP